MLLSRGSSWSVGFAIQDEAMDFSRSAHSKLTTMRPLLTYHLNWELKREQGAYGTPYSAQLLSIFIAAAVLGMPD